MEINSALNYLDFSVIGIYLVVLLSIGVWVSFSKKSKSDDLFLAGQSLGWFNVGLSIFGTNVSPSMLISACGIAYAAGVVGCNVEWMAWIFIMLLAMVFVPHYMNTNICTMPQFMERRYGSACRNFLAWYSLLTIMSVWLGANLYAGGVLMGQIMGWPIWFSVIFLMVIAATLTVCGGLKAVAITNTYQSILMICVSASLSVIGFMKVGSLDRLINSVPETHWQLFRPLNDPQFPWPTFVLGWPIGAIFFWCTDQTIVQHILGARDLKQGQLGAFFASSLKVMTPLFFFLPGIMCKVLHPNLASEDEAYMTMVTTYLPNGLIGLIVAILIAALVSTIDSALNSFSTIFTLDVYSKQIRPNADPKEIKLAGRIVTASAAVCGIILAIALGGVKGMNLFSLLQTITFSFAPSMAVVFLLGVAWKRANSTGAFLTLIFGNTFTVAVGICYLTKWPSLEFWDHPSRHYLMLAFYNFLIVGTFMIVTTLLTKPPLPEHQLPPIKEAYAKFGQHAGVIWKWWGILAFIMVIVYIIFN